MSSGAMHDMFLAPETQYGVTVVDPSFTHIRQTGTTLGLSKESLTSAELTSDRQVNSIRHGTRQVGGDINVELSYGSHDSLLEAVLAGTWENNVLKAGNVRRSFNLLRHFLDIEDAPYWSYLGVEINSLSLTLSSNAIATGTFGVIGQDQPEASSDEPDGAVLGAPTTTDVMDTFTGEVKLNGQQIALATELTLSLDNGMDTRFVIGSDMTLRPTLKKSNLTGNFSAYFESASMVNTFIKEQYVSLEFDVKDPDGNILRFNLPKIKFTGGQPDISGEDDIILSMPFTAVKDPTLGSQISITRIPKA